LAKAKQKAALEPNMTPSTQEEEIKTQLNTGKQADLRMVDLADRAIANQNQQWQRTINSSV